MWKAHVYDVNILVRVWERERASVCECVSVCRWDKKELMPCIWHSKLLYNSFNVQTLICFYGFTIVRVCIVDLVSHGNQSLPYLAPYTHGLKHFWRRNRENAEEGEGMRRRPHFFISLLYFQIGVISGIFWMGNGIAMWQIGRILLSLKVFPLVDLIVRISTLNEPRTTLKLKCFFSLYILSLSSCF